MTRSPLLSRLGILHVICCGQAACNSTAQACGKGVEGDRALGELRGAGKEAVGNQWTPLSAHPLWGRSPCRMLRCSNRNTGVCTELLNVPVESPVSPPKSC